MKSPKPVMQIEDENLRYSDIEKSRVEQKLPEKIREDYQSSAQYILEVEQYILEARWRKYFQKEGINHDQCCLQVDAPLDLSLGKADLDMSN